MSRGLYNILIEKLDAFTRKYYKNQLIRGGIYSFSLLLLFFLCVTALEYFGQFNTTVRTVLFYCYLLGNGYVITKLIFIPLVKIYKLGKIISHEEAARIIGKHFNNVQDKPFRRWRRTISHKSIFITRSQHWPKNQRAETRPLFHSHWPGAKQEVFEIFRYPSFITSDHRLSFSRNHCGWHQTAGKASDLFWTGHALSVCNWKW